MDNKKNNDDQLKLSRRTFLKRTTAGIAGSLLVCANTNFASATTQVSQTTEKQSQINVFTDYLGRKESLPNNIERVVPSGHFAQILLCSLCPEKLASLASKFSGTVAGYSEISFDSLKAQYQRGGMGNIFNLPESGDLYSCHQRTIKTSLIASIDFDVLIDVGFNKSDLKLSLDYLETNIDKPAIFIDASFGNLPQAYRTLGNLLGYSSRAELLASYIEKLYADIEDKRNGVRTARKVLYAGNDLGLNTSCIQNEAIEYLGEIPVIVPNGSQDNEIDASSLQNQSTDYVIFNSHKCFNSISNKTGQPYEIWSDVQAIKKGNYAVAPALYYSWVGCPPLFPQIIGLPWLGNKIWPLVYNYDMVKMTTEFYNLFFNYSLSSDEAVQLLGFPWNIIWRDEDERA